MKNSINNIKIIILGISFFFADRSLKSEDQFEEGTSQQQVDQQQLLLQQQKPLINKQLPDIVLNLKIENNKFVNIKYCSLAIPYYVKSPGDSCIIEAYDNLEQSGKPLYKGTVIDRSLYLKGYYTNPNSNRKKDEIFEFESDIIRDIYIELDDCKIRPDIISFKAIPIFKGVPLQNSKPAIVNYKLEWGPDKTYAISKINDKGVNIEPWPRVRQPAYITNNQLLNLDGSFAVSWNKVHEAFKYRTNVTFIKNDNKRESVSHVHSYLDNSLRNSGIFFDKLSGSKSIQTAINLIRKKEISRFIISLETYDIKTQKWLPAQVHKFKMKLYDSLHRGLLQKTDKNWNPIYNINKNSIKKAEIISPKNGSVLPARGTDFRIGKSKDTDGKTSLINFEWTKTTGIYEIVIYENIKDNKHFNPKYCDPSYKDRKRITYFKSIVNRERISYADNIMYPSLIPLDGRTIKVQLSTFNPINGIWLKPNYYSYKLEDLMSESKKKVARAVIIHISTEHCEKGGGKYICSLPQPKHLINGRIDRTSPDPYNDEGLQSNINKSFSHANIQIDWLPSIDVYSTILLTDFGEIMLYEKFKLNRVEDINEYVKTLDEKKYQDLINVFQDKKILKIFIFNINNFHHNKRNMSGIFTYVNSNSKIDSEYDYNDGYILLNGLDWQLMGTYRIIHEIGHALGMGKGNSALKHRATVQQDLKYLDARIPGVMSYPFKYSNLDNKWYQFCGFKGGRGNKFDARSNEPESLSWHRNACNIWLPYEISQMHSGWYLNK